MKLLMFSGGLDSTYLAWKVLNENSDLDGVHIHYVSIRNDAESIWKKEDVRTTQIIKYFRDKNFFFEYSTSKFEFFGQTHVGFDSDLLMVVAQKVSLNLYGGHIDVLLGWNPYDLQVPLVADRYIRQVTQNIWKSVAESGSNKDRLNKDLQFPLIDQNITKDIMIKTMPKELYDLTWSCRKDGDLPCNECGSCIERNKFI